MDNKDLNISYVTKEIMQKFLGDVIDFATMSINDDKARHIFNKRVKNSFFGNLEILNNEFVSATSFKTSPTEQLLQRVSDKKADEK